MASIYATGLLHIYLGYKLKRTAAACGWSERSGQLYNLNFMPFVMLKHQFQVLMCY